MTHRGIVEVLGLAVATPIVAAVLALGLSGMAWYGEHSEWAAKRSRVPGAHQGETHAPLAPFALTNERSTQ